MHTLPTTLSSLLALSSLTSSSAIPSPAHNAKFCLTDITYNSSMVYSTPAHLATYGGQISFNSILSADPIVAHCSAYGRHLQDMFYGEFVYECSVPEGHGAVKFSYSRPGNTVVVNQTWSRNGQDFFATGTGNADLKCETTYWQNANWTMGQLYSTTNVDCAPATLEVKAKVEKV